MTTPSDPENGQSPPDPVNLGKADAPAASDAVDDQPFDPYRFGKPDYPIPAEYAPPGYTGPIAPPPNTYAGGPSASALPPGANPANPFANPPGTSYGPNGPQPPYAGGPQSPYAGGPQSPYGAPTDSQYGYGPAQQQPYGAPPPYGYGLQPPPYSGYVQPTSTNGKAIAALVLGIASIVLCWLSIFDAVFVILALIFGLIALNETKEGRSRGRGLAVAGLVCMVVGALLATLISIKVFRAVDRCGGLDQADRSSFNQCLKDNL
jgi:hypothetical protein